jgi:hypothetical protein
MNDEWGSGWMVRSWPVSSFFPSMCLKWQGKSTKYLTVDYMCVCVRARARVCEIGASRIRNWNATRMTLK